MPCWCLFNIRFWRLDSGFANGSMIFQIFNLRKLEAHQIHPFARPLPCRHHWQGPAVSFKLMPMSGYVYLIGAGPGDPNLLTLRGAQCLAAAEVVLYDGLVNPEILRHCSTNAHLICVGKHGRQRIWTQAEILAELLDHAGRGRRVARLKGGDPAVFARGAEEATALRDAGIDFEIVPGITVALAASSYAGIPITHRDHASAVALVTGHTQEATPGSEDPIDLDWPALAKFPGTLVIYMGVTTAPKWTKELLNSGKSPDTPTAIVRRCTWPDQQILRCKLKDIPEHLGPGSKIRPPVIVIIGEVTNLQQTLAWFDRRPLFGKRILVTRPKEQATELRTPLEEMGAEVLFQPAIEILPPEDWSEIDKSLHEIEAFDWLIFSSRNGVQSYLDRLLQIGYDTRALAGCRIAAVGARTAEALADYALAADQVPEDFKAESLVEALQDSARGKSILSIRANRGRDILARGLTAAGASVTEIVAYRSQDIAKPDSRIARLMADGSIDWTTVTSSAIARSIHKMFPSDLANSKLASISPITSGTLQDLGHSIAAEASPHTMQGLVESIRKSNDQ